MDSVKLWLVATFAAAALAGAYIFWGPSQRPKKRRKDWVPGLQNLGNSCFMNAVLQAISSCPSFINWLGGVNKVYYGGDGNNNFSLAMALLSTLKALNNEGKSDGIQDVCTPAAVIGALRARRWVISNEEQDAHELFHVLTTTLEEEFVPSPSVLSLLEVRKLEESASDNCPPKIFTKSSVPCLVKYTSPTRGLLASQLKCKKCGFKYPVCYDTFDSISLTIPSPHWGQLHLHDCLQKFVSCELVQDVTCENCTCKQHEQMNSGEEMSQTAKTTFIKQLTFGKLPECLCIHIQRTVWLNNGMPMKCFDHVDFPEFLVMDDYVFHSSKKKKNVDGVNYPWARLIGGSHIDTESDETPGSSAISPSEITISQPAILNTLKRRSLDVGSLPSVPSPEKSITCKDHLYMLKAVIVHLGDVFSGHFITYRHGPVNSHSRHKWFCTSDIAVREVPLSEVLQATAYMLFYERITLTN